MIINADCRTIPMGAIKKCACILTDPPFSPHVHENAISSGTIATGGPHDRDLEFEALTPELRAWLTMAAAFVPRWSLFFSDVESLRDWQDDGAAAGLEYIRTIPWIRWSQPQLSGDRPPTGSDCTILFHAMDRGPRGGLTEKRKRWNGSGNLTHFDSRCLRGSDKHPTEKPLDLALEIVNDFSEFGERVFDPFAGFGTIPLACRLLGRECLGVEKRADWAKRAEQREVGLISTRDLTRAEEWLERTFAEVARCEAMNDGEDTKSAERCARRKAGAEHVRRAIKGAA